MQARTTRALQSQTDKCRKSRICSCPCRSLTAAHRDRVTDQTILVNRRLDRKRDGCLALLNQLGNWWRMNFGSFLTLSMETIIEQACSIFHSGCVRLGFNSPRLQRETLVRIVKFSIRCLQLSPKDRDTGRSQLPSEVPRN